MFKKFAQWFLNADPTWYRPAWMYYVVGDYEKALDVFLRDLPAYPPNPNESRENALDHLHFYQLLVQQLGHNERLGIIANRLMRWCYWMQGDYYWKDQGYLHGDYNGGTRVGDGDIEIAHINAMLYATQIGIFNFTGVVMPQALSVEESIARVRHYIDVATRGGILPVGGTHYSLGTSSLLVQGINLLEMRESNYLQSLADYLVRMHTYDLKATELHGDIEADRRTSLILHAWVPTAMQVVTMLGDSEQRERLLGRIVELLPSSLYAIALGPLQRAVLAGFDESMLLQTAPYRFIGTHVADGVGLVLQHSKDSMVQTFFNVPTNEDHDASTGFGNFRVYLNGEWAIDCPGGYAQGWPRNNVAAFYGVDIMPERELVSSIGNITRGRMGGTMPSPQWDDPPQFVDLMKRPTEYTYTWDATTKRFTVEIDYDLNVELPDWFVPIGPAFEWHLFVDGVPVIEQNSTTATITWETPNKQTIYLSVANSIGEVTLETTGDGWNYLRFVSHNHTQKFLAAIEITATIVDPPAPPVEGVSVQDENEATISGEWVTWADGLNGDLIYATSSPDKATSFATYKFAVKPGRYGVAATYTPYYNRATNARYSVNQQTVFVDQQQAPEDFESDGAKWKRLGVFDVTENELQIQIDNQCDGFVIVDAIRIERIGDIPVTPVEPDTGVRVYTKDGVEARATVDELIIGPQKFSRVIG